MAISSIFPAFSAGTEFFSKFGLGHILNIANAHLYGKNQKKTNDEILRKCQKTGFSGIFPAFSAGNEFFLEIGLRHILGITILHHCAKNQEKLMSRSREKLVTNEPTNQQTNERTKVQKVDIFGSSFQDTKKERFIFGHGYYNRN